MTAAPTVISSLIGGIMIGLAAVVLFAANGRLAGISGIVGSTVAPRRDGGQEGWRLALLAGMAAVGLLAHTVSPDSFAFGIERSVLAIAVGGLLVGFGTQLGGGCTSGHGVCGNARLSPRSLVATVTFIATGALTVWVIQNVLGGAL